MVREQRQMKRDPVTRLTSPPLLHVLINTKGYRDPAYIMNHFLLAPPTPLSRNQHPISMQSFSYSVVARGVTNREKT